jgi:SAM-dependent methyltransferase
MDSIELRSFVSRPSGQLFAGEPAAFDIEFEVAAPIVFDLDVSIEFLRREDGSRPYARNLRQDYPEVAWLPRGTYRLAWHCPRLALPPGPYVVRVGLWDRRLGKQHLVVVMEYPLILAAGSENGSLCAAWSLESAGEIDLTRLSWRKGASDWFHKHFDHAAPTVISYMLGDTPLLRGRILDVGCGDGITDLGIALRTEPECLIGIDPFRGYERLPEILAANQLDPSVIPPCLQFMPVDANHLPFEDDSFDVVLSWGSVEHIAGGYQQSLLEMRRVLRDGGRLFIHPGLYYSSIGHHLGEFSAEPHVHLRRTRESLRDLVINTPPSYIDRAGEFSTPEQYWQWFEELNPITVDGFEQELRMLGFEFDRAALRTDERIDYTPEMQRYPLLHLGIAEIYLACTLRKPARHLASHENTAIAPLERE